jgi:DNA-binding cell septation regulator SpoVG
MILQSILILLFMVFVNPTHSLALTILQPQPNTVFHPGDTVQVLAEPGPDETFVPGVLLDAGEIDGGLDIKAPYDFEFKIPPQYLGVLRITARGKTTDGRILEAEVQILVTLPPSVVLEGIRVRDDQKTLFMRVGSKRPVDVYGQFSDGIERDVSSPFMGTTYTTSNEKVATVDANGLVTAVGPGTARITIKNGKHELTVEAIVKAKP